MESVQKIKPAIINSEIIAPKNKQEENQEKNEINKQEKSPLRIEFEIIAKFIFSNFTDLNNAISFNKGGFYYNISFIEDKYDFSKFPIKNSAIIPDNSYSENDLTVINSYLALQLPYLIFKQISDKVENNNIGFAIRKRNVEIRGFDGKQYNQKTLLTYNNEELIQYLSKIENNHTSEYDKVSSCDFMHEINPVELHLINLFIDHKQHNLANINNHYNQELKEIYQKINDNNLVEDLLDSQQIKIGSKNLTLAINNKNYKIYHINDEIFTIADNYNIPLNNNHDLQKLIEQERLEIEKIEQERLERERIEIENIIPTLKQQNKEWTDYLADCLEQKSSGTLDLRNSQINDEDIVIIVKALKNPNCKLQELWLDDNNISDEAIKILAEALKSGECQLQVLWLSESNITDEGAKALADALQSGNCQLQELWLDDNNINDAGAEFLAEALKKGECRLQNLWLNKNNITDEGAKALADALQSGNCQLQKLDLGWNNITDESTKVLADALQSGNCQLQELGICGNKITDAGAEFLAEALKSPNCKIININIYGCYQKMCDNAIKARENNPQPNNNNIQPQQQAQQVNKNQSIAK